VGEVGITSEEDGAAGASARLRTEFMIGQRGKPRGVSGCRKEGEKRRKQRVGGKTAAQMPMLVESGEVTGENQAEVPL
jgi:hypothetical protein